MAEELNAFEKKIRNLEFNLQLLSRRIDSLAQLAGKAAQDASQVQPILPNNGNPTYRFQVITSPIGAAAGAAVGTGTARLINPIGGVRYWKTSGTAGAGYQDVTVWNDTGGSIPVNTFLVCAMCDGQMTILVADCLAASPAACADDVTAPGYSGP